MQQHGGGELAYVATLLRLNPERVLPDANEVRSIVRAVFGGKGMRKEFAGKFGVRSEGSRQCGNPAHARRAPSPASPELLDNIFW